MNNGILRCEVDIRASWNPAGHTSTVVEPSRSPVVMMMQQQEPKIVVFEDGYRGSMTVLATFRDFACMGQVVEHLTVSRTFLAFLGGTFLLVTFLDSPSHFRGPLTFLNLLTFFDSLPYPPTCSCTPSTLSIITDHSPTPTSTSPA